MPHPTTPALAFLFLLAVPATARAQQTYVERMDAAFAQRAPRVGDMLPDAVAFTAEGKPFALQDTRGKLTVLVTGCLT